MKRPAALPASLVQAAPHLIDKLEGDRLMVEPVPFRSSQRDQLREERLEILHLLEASTITAEEAATLLDALDRAALPLPNSGFAKRRAEVGNQVPELRGAVLTRRLQHGHISCTTQVPAVDHGHQDHQP